MRTSVYTIVLALCATSLITTVEAVQISGGPKDLAPKTKTATKSEKNNQEQLKFQARFEPDVVAKLQKSEPAVGIQAEDEKQKEIRDLRQKFYKELFLCRQGKDSRISSNLCLAPGKPLYIRGKELGLDLKKSMNKTELIREKHEIAMADLELVIKKQQYDDIQLQLDDDIRLKKERLVQEEKEKTRLQLVKKKEADDIRLKLADDIRLQLADDIRLKLADDIRLQLADDIRLKKERLVQEEEEKTRLELLKKKEADDIRLKLEKANLDKPIYMNRTQLGNAFTAWVTTQCKPQAPPSRPGKLAPDVPYIKELQELMNHAVILFKIDPKVIVVPEIEPKKTTNICESVRELNASVFANVNGNKNRAIEDKINEVSYFIN